MGRARKFGSEITEAFAAGVPRVEVRVDVTDADGALAALAAGLRFEGIARGGLDGARDLAVFARLADDSDDPIAPALPPLPSDGLSDGVVVVRVAEAADAAALIEQDLDPLTVANGFTGVAPPAAEITRMAARAGLEHVAGKATTLTVLEAVSGLFAGSVRLRLNGPPGVAGIGYAAHPALRGRGYPARALRLVVRWAFDDAGLARLELGAKTANVASQRVALNAGFEPDGIRVGRLRAPDGTFSDEVRFVLLNPRLIDGQSASRISP